MYGEWLKREIADVIEFLCLPEISRFDLTLPHHLDDDLLSQSVQKNIDDLWIDSSWRLDPDEKKNRHIMGR